MYKCLKYVTYNLQYVTLYNKSNTDKEFCYKLKSPDDAYLKGNA